MHLWQVQKLNVCMGAIIVHSFLDSQLINCHYQCVEKLLKNPVAIDPAGSQYIDYADTFTHAYSRLACISLTKRYSKF